MKQTISSFPSSLQKIVVRMPNWLGDCVMATPILADIRRKWPQAHITALCKGSIKTLLQEDPHIDECVSFVGPKSWLNPKAHREVKQSIQAGQYDLGILLTNSFSSAWWFWLADIPYRVGYATHARTPLLNIPVNFPSQRDHQHLVLTYKMLLESIGIPLSETSPQLYLTLEELKNAREKLISHGIQVSDRIIGINPGAAYGSAKCWLPERFKILTERLLDDSSVKVVFFGDPAGAPLVKEICEGFPNQVINLAGSTSLRELMALISHCTLLLTNDSGPMHVASALGIPLIALFGSTSDKTTSPYRGGRVIHKHVACSPCYRRECPIDFRCMTRIEVQEVHQHIQELVHEIQGQ